MIINEYNLSSETCLGTKLSLSCLSVCFFFSALALRVHCNLFILTISARERQQVQWQKSFLDACQNIFRFDFTFFVSIWLFSCDKQIISGKMRKCKLRSFANSDICLWPYLSVLYAYEDVGIKSKESHKQCPSILR